MIRTQREMDAVRKATHGLEADAQAKVIEIVDRVGVDDYMALRDALMAEVMPVMELASQLAAELGASIYNAWRFIDLGETTETQIVYTFTPDKGEAAINTATKRAKDGRGLDDVVAVVMSRISYDITASYGKTLFACGRKDTKKPRYARVPGRSEHYADGCPFCRMLASRGFVYYSEKSAGGPDHYHADCTCEVVCSWDKSPKAQNYDPSEFRNEYYNSMETKEQKEYVPTGRDYANVELESGIESVMGKSGEYWQQAAARARENNRERYLEEQREAYRVRRLESGNTYTPRQR